MKKLILSVLTAGAVLASAHASATVIILDNLGNPGAINGRTPDTTDLPGSTWVQPYDYGFGSGVGETTIGGATVGYMYARGQFQNVIAFSNGTYTAPTTVTISSENVNYGNTGDGGGVGDPTRGTGFGVFANDTAGSGQPNSGQAYSAFSGFVLGESSGGFATLTLYNNRVEGQTVTTTDTNLGGPMSFNYDSATGVISDFTYDGTNYTSDFTDLTVQSGDTYAGDTVSSASGGGTGYLFYNFEVSTPAEVPEPTTDALFALGGCLVLAGWLRVRRSKA